MRGQRHIKPQVSIIRVVEPGCPHEDSKQSEGMVYVLCECSESSWSRIIKSQEVTGDTLQGPAGFLQRVLERPQRNDQDAHVGPVQSILL